MEIHKVKVGSHPSSYFRCLKVNQNKILPIALVSQRIPKTITNLMKLQVLLNNNVMFYFQAQSPTLVKLSILKGKFGEWVNFDVSR